MGWKCVPKILDEYKFGNKCVERIEPIVTRWEK
jgi:hypothetical protein